MRCTIEKGTYPPGCSTKSASTAISPPKVPPGIADYASRTKDMRYFLVNTGQSSTEVERVNRRYRRSTILPETLFLVSSTGVDVLATRASSNSSWSVTTTTTSDWSNTAAVSSDRSMSSGQL